MHLISEKLESLYLETYPLCGTYTISLMLSVPWYLHYGVFDLLLKLASLSSPHPHTTHSTHTPLTPPTHPLHNPLTPPTHTPQSDAALNYTRDARCVQKPFSTDQQHLSTTLLIQGNIVFCVCERVIVQSAIPFQVVSCALQVTRCRSNRNVAVEIVTTSNAERGNWPSYCIPDRSYI